jgi:hydroxyacylglutathione hydrolase
MPERIRVQRYAVGPFQQNVYLLLGPSGRKAALVDPGIESEGLLEVAEARGLEIELILNTHGHLDHVAGNRFFKDRTGAPVAIHALDVPYLDQIEQQGAAFGLRVQNPPPPDLLLAEGTPVRFDGVELDVIHTPGHTPGGVCLRFGDRMLVGDTLFQGSVGRTDLPGGDWRALVASIREKLFRLPGGIVCYPGHGPETTLEEERRHNPFVSDAAVGASGAKSR